MDITSYVRNAALAGTGIMAVYAAPYSLEQKVYADEPVASNPNPPDKKNAPAEKSLEEKVVDRINFYRNIAGLDPVVLDPEISKACQAHANYLMRNNIRSSTHSLEEAHSENPNSPGYTKEGAKMAKLSDIGYGKDPIESTNDAMKTFFHRISYLDPRLGSVGIGYSSRFNKNKENKWTVTSFKKEAKKLLEIITAYPADKQTDVPLTYFHERPDPIPEDQDRIAGFPITLTFYDWNYPKGSQGTIKKLEYIKTKDETKLGKKEIPSWFSSPEKPASQEYQGPTICLIPKDPLEHGTTYELTVTGILNNQPWEKTWQFTTVKQEVSDSVRPPR